MRFPRAEVLVATTWECNLCCSYCFVREQGLSAEGGRMSRELAARVITALDTGLADVEAICVHLYGGEPLLNLTAIEAMVEQSRRLAPGRVTFTITTNGTCASPAAVDLLARGGFQIILSIDGPAAVKAGFEYHALGMPALLP